MIIRPHAQPRTGVAAVEFAVVLPLLLIFLFGLWEVGRMVHVKQIVQNAAREGARAASTGFNNFGEIETVVLDYLANSGIDTTGVTVTVENVTLNVGPNYDATTSTQLNELEIVVSLPFENVRWMTTGQVSAENGQWQYGDPSSGQFISARAIWRSMKDLPVTVDLTGAAIPQTPVN